MWDNLRCREEASGTFISVTAWEDQKRNLLFVDSQGSSHGYTCFLSCAKTSEEIVALCGSQELS